MYPLRLGSFNQPLVRIDSSVWPMNYSNFKFGDYDHYNAKQQMDSSLGIEETLEGAMECDFEFDISLYAQGGMRAMKPSNIPILGKEDAQVIDALLEHNHEKNILLDDFDAGHFPELF
ncbi:hypothetical protein P280DRAFT_512312 [Massarina eburnea CBS 473.64]|uniref:Uncharacterized protein n=1 Tax=Massarina eburnea CBS 473.64 TaxID=1395130 RepID=A0A6A6SDY3_9PLEO|nr:hypothetical protein P280DRAFT_512312 [Massarina eburnea CBS 473.64]